MTHVRGDIIPEDLSAVVHDAAGALASGSYELERVMRRQRTHRRRVVAGLSLVGAAVMAVAVAIPLAIRPNTVAEPVGDDPSGVAQRLFYHVPHEEGAESGSFGFRRARPGIADPLTYIRIPGGIVELDSSGKLVQHKVPGPHLDVAKVIGLPDGGLAVFGLRASRPGEPPVEQPDDSMPEMLSVLTVIGPDGALRLTRDLGVASRELSLVGATDGAAYFLRGDQLLRHEFASGVERAVAPGRVSELVEEGWTVDSVVSGRIVMAKNNADGVLVRTLALSGADETDPAVVCAESGVIHASLRLAPGGHLLACAATEEAKSGRERIRLVITDLSTGERVADRDVEPPGRLGGTAALAWTDDHTLRLATYQLPSPPGGEYDLHEIVKQETIKI
jgi:hypothetical protein